MNKILVVARSEFATAVRSKAFVFGILVMPVFIGLAIGVQALLEDHVDSEDRRFAVVDNTGFLYEALESRAGERNAKIARGMNGDTKGPRFLPVPATAEGRSAEDLRLELSEKVLAKELFAFVELAAAVKPVDGAYATELRYYSDHPTYGDLRHWIEGVINEELRERRFAAADIDKTLVKRVAAINRYARAENLGLVVRDEKSGAIKDAEEVDEIRTIAAPVILMFLLFMIVMSSAPQLLNTVLEEKMGRISEVLLGSVTPFQLMLGKLIGSAGVSGVLAAIYLGGGFFIALYFGYADVVPLGIFLWFLLFLVLTVFFFGSVFIAVGSACTEIKDTQGLMLPVMVVLMVPCFTFQPILEAPSSPLAVGLSLFPPATPMLMLLRLSLHPGPPLWQVALSVVLLCGSTVACVWAAGKIFRTGILMQGKSASPREILRWLRA